MPERKNDVGFIIGLFGFIVIITSLFNFTHPIIGCFGIIIITFVIGYYFGIHVSKPKGYPGVYPHKGFEWHYRAWTSLEGFTEVVIQKTKCTGDGHSIEVDKIEGKKKHILILHCPKCNKIEPFPSLTGDVEVSYPKLKDYVERLISSDIENGIIYLDKKKKMWVKSEVPSISE